MKSALRWHNAFGRLVRNKYVRWNDQAIDFFIASGMMRALSLRVRSQFHYVRILPPSAPVALWPVVLHGIHCRFEYVSASLVNPCSAVDLASGNGSSSSQRQPVGTLVAGKLIQRVGFTRSSISPVCCSPPRPPHGAVDDFWSWLGWRFFAGVGCAWNLGDCGKRAAAQR